MMRASLTRRQDASKAYGNQSTLIYGAAGNQG
jgi:hypothetical protein